MTTLTGFMIKDTTWPEEHSCLLHTVAQTPRAAWDAWLGPWRLEETSADRSIKIQKWHDRGLRVVPVTVTVGETKMNELATTEPRTIRLEDLTPEAMEEWCGRLVHIQSDKGLWRHNAKGYTHHFHDAWRVDFETAYEYTKHCGPEKRVEYIWADAIIGCTSGVSPDCFGVIKSVRYDEGFNICVACQNDGG